MGHFEGLFHGKSIICSITWSNAFFLFFFFCYNAFCCSDVICKGKQFERQVSKVCATSTRKMRFDIVKRRQCKRENKRTLCPVRSLRRRLLDEDEHLPCNPKKSKVRSHQRSPHGLQRERENRRTEYALWQVWKLFRKRSLWWRQPCGILGSGFKVCTIFNIQLRDTFSERLYSLMTQSAVADLPVAEHSCWLLRTLLFVLVKQPPSETPN